MFIGKRIRIALIAASVACLSAAILPTQALGLTRSEMTVVVPAGEGEGIRQVIVNSAGRVVTLEEVARLMESDPELVAAMNERAVDSIVKPGEQVIMPSRGWLDHTVRSGDTLWGLAQTYGISIEEIVTENELGLSTLLVTGQKLTIPLSEASVVMAVPENKQSGEETTKPESAQANRSAHESANEAENQPQKEQQNELQNQLQNLPKNEAEEDTRLAEVARQELTSITWPLHGYITSRYGPREESVHEGLDIAAPDGDYIRAALPGQVVFAGTRGTYGNAVILKHPSGVRTLYAHASRLLVNQGEEVRPGQAIALVGSTGHSTGPHLHFEVLFKGLPLNPLEFLP